MKAAETAKPAGGAGVWLTVQASSVLSLVLMGDSLIYAVLPVMAQEFGISAIWVGVLLSANRFARLIVNFSLVRLSRNLDLRQMAIIGAVFGAASTVAYGLFSGPWLLLMARIVWGTAFSLLRLVTQGYATMDRHAMGWFLGLSGAVSQIGTIAAYTLGAWMVGAIGPQKTFFLIGAVGLLALWPAMKLPAGIGPEPARRSIRRPRFEDLVAFTTFFAKSGILMATASLLFYEAETSAATAVFIGGLVLLGPRVFSIIAAPFIGRVADYLGHSRIYIASMLLSGIGFMFVGFDITVIGLALLIFGGGAVTLLLPAIAVGRGGDETLLDLASIATWGDLGAALGALAGGSLVAFVSPEALYLVMGLLLLGLTIVESRVLLARRAAK